MKLHYKGKYDKNPESIPSKPHKPNCVKFKEPENSKKLALMVNLIAIPIMLIFYIPVLIVDLKGSGTHTILALVLYLIGLFPHEILHALCFKEDVYLFTNFKHGMLFVAGPEDMSKARFIFMSLLPNIVLGVIPYVIFVINPTWTTLGALGALNLTAGSGDYLNVFNAITQMPKGARTYLHQFNSYWFIPEE
ncbi:MAG: DUF3267 domain-containing protein [Clostridia bacterium]|nr:DUF3267 domain-containing protein [Clostridia bacterium]